MVSRYLSQALLTLGERTWLERMASARIRLYEVRAVRKDQGLTLRDLWNETVIEVRKRLATHQLAAWDLLAVRVIEGEHGDLVMEGTPWIFAPMQGPPLLKELRRMHRQLLKREPGLDEDTFFRGATLIFQDFWFDEVATAPLPQFATTDGDELTLVRVTFEVAAEGRARALLREAGFDEDPNGRTVWLDRDGRRVLGDVKFDPSSSRSKAARHGRIPTCHSCGPSWGSRAGE